MPVIVDGSTIRLYGGLAFTSGQPDDFTAGEVAQAMAGLNRGAPIKVYINCHGGNAFDGASIHSILSGWGDMVETIVEGLAASGGSLIAMAGKKITMMPGSLMMVHDCSVGCYGTADVHRAMADDCDLMSETYAAVYARRTGKPVSVCRSLMKAETWFNPETAVAEKFADEIGAGAAVQAAAFDYSIYANAPRHLIEMAKANGWSRNAVSQAKERGMTTDSDGAKAPLKAIIKSTEAEGRAELAEHLAFETDMPVSVALAMLAKAPSSVTPANLVAATDARRLSAAALAMPSVDERRPATERRVDLAASMKRRHGIA